MLDWFWWLLDTENFMPRRCCGTWPDWLATTSQVADVTIALAYFAIPVLLWWGWLRKRNDLPSPWILLAFGTFIFFCGVGHVCNAVVFNYPAYNLYVLVEVLTAVASIATAIALASVLRTLVDYPTPEEFRRQANRASLAEAEAILRAGEAERLRDAALARANQLEEISRRLSADMHLYREAADLRRVLVGIRQEVAHDV